MKRFQYIIILFLLVSSLGTTAQVRINGMVFNALHEPLIGASVIVDPIHMQLSTDSLGKFELNVSKDLGYTISVSFLGYETLRKKIEISGNRILIEFSLKESIILSEDVVVSATRAGNKTPMAYSNIEIGRKTDKESGVDMPFLLSMSPSLVATSDAGTGIGYTNFRIRGSDANRINMTVNGVPLNDAESHTVFWVNMPDFASSTDNVQIQRGVGSSTNGAGAFGGTVNMQTNKLDQHPYAQWSAAGGSFNTLKNSVMAGSGLLNGKFVVDMRLSKINSDGYVDRAYSDLKSFYLSAGYFSDHSILRLLFFSGKEKTYQSWNGISSSILCSDRTYNPSGIIYDKEGNVSFYDNETDNYQQDHYQLHWSYRINPYLSGNFSMHYTYGRGFYEEYRQDKALADYGMQEITLGNNTISKTDLIRQKWLDNDFYGAITSLNYKKEWLDMTLGSAINNYSGDHFGKVIWAKYYGENPVNREWYHSSGNKIDFNIFGKSNFQVSNSLSLYVDFQFRLINYEISGIDDDLRNITQTHHFNFFNPKIGGFLTLSPKTSIYFSYGNGHREPNRSNYTDADPGNAVPQPETLHDLELGLRSFNNKYQFEINLYDMIYRDQLILTGEINDVGAAIMTNVAKSYRIGIEYSGNWQMAKKWRWQHHVTLSESKIVDFTEYVDDWDHWGEQIVTPIGKSDIAFSPKFIAGSIFLWDVNKNLNISFQSNWVSKQFIDNSSSDERKLNSYFVNNLKFNFSPDQRFCKKLSFFVQINNIFNEKYESNAWVYSYYAEGKRQKEDGYFPQAGVNFLAGLTIGL